MSTVSLSNTSANLSGKTAVLAEADQTITGLQTFSRSTAAPFAVNAGSATVANLRVAVADAAADATHAHNADHATTADSAANVVYERLYSQNALDTSTAAANLVAVPISGCALNDVLDIYFDVWISGASSLSTFLFDLFATGTGGSNQVLNLVGPTAGPNVTSYMIAQYHITIKATPNYPLTVCCSATANVASGTEVRGTTFGNVQTLNSFLSPFTLFFRQMSGNPEGIPLQWALRIYRLKSA